MRVLALLLPLLAADLGVAQSRPCLMPWQRNLADALALVKRTGKPLLICVNMDGEPACENLAWGRYRDPDFAKLARGFVCVVASPNRHTKRDRDDAGRRIVDPRFGRVTSEEHIAIEPILFARYFKNNRVAPRHLAIDKDGKELFDIFLTRGLTPIDDALKKHGKPTPAVDPRKVSVDDLLDSPDAAHRTRLERNFGDADPLTRARLAAASLSKTRGTQHPDLTYMGLRDPDARVRLAAADAVIGLPNGAPSLWSDVFRVAERDVARTARLAEALRPIEAASRLAAVTTGWSVASRIVDAAAWRAALAKAAPPAPADPDIDALLSELDRRIRADSNDPALQLQLADATMRLVRAKLAQGSDASLLLIDVAEAAKRAQALRPSGKASGYLAWASFLSNDLGGALDAATAALPALHGDAASELAKEVLLVFAGCRVRALYAAWKDKTPWPATWIADIRDAYDALMAHPACTEAEILGYLQWLGAIDARGAQRRVLGAAIARLPASGKLHEQLRTVLLRDGGAAALEAACAELSAPAGQQATLEWFVGLALLVAAERHVSNEAFDAALTSYSRSVANFRSSLKRNASFADSANHYICLASAGRARLLADEAAYEQAAKAIAAGIEAAPKSAKTKDGLGNTPLDTAQMLLGLLRQEELTDHASRLEATLRKHDLQ